MTLAKEDQEAKCYYCGQSVNDMSGNPSFWKVKLPHKDEPGKMKPHHIGCVVHRLENLQPQDQEAIREAMEVLGRISHHMSCDYPAEECDCRRKPIDKALAKLHKTFDGRLDA